MKLRTLTAMALALFPAAGLLAQDPGGGEPSDYVAVEQGVLHGRSLPGVTQFLGVPFARPPVLELRWRAPAPPAHWSGVREATQFGDACLQPAGAGNTIGSEDCLYLNVYRPAHVPPGSRLPVMLFVHGGSNVRQSGASYDPSSMVEHEGIIVVTTNYRLNVLGWLALPALDAEARDTSSGNYGLMDQQAAMRWVQANIGRFGGDPARVTVAGESAGAIDGCANLVSPEAAGLFSRMILESMYCPTASHAEALSVGAPVAQELDCTDAATQASCMRAVPAAKVLAAAGKPSIVVGGGEGFNASPNFGNRLLPLLPAEAIGSGRWNRAGILIGSNHDEAALFVAAKLSRASLPGNPFPPSNTLYELLVKTSFPSLADEVAAAYPLEDFTNTFIAYSDEVTDSSPLGCEVSRWSDIFSQAAVTFRYELNEPSPPPPPELPLPAGFSIGAYHGSELQFLFQTPLLPGPQTDAQRELSAQMIRYWGNFVRTGDPNGAHLTYWPVYEPQRRQILSLSSTAGDAPFSDFDTDHRCAFWAAHPVSGQ